MSRGLRIQRAPRLKHAYSTRSSTADLKSLGLGWHYGLCGLADAGPNGSGTSLIKALAHVLQYVLPFELKGALARRAMHIPDRFLAEKLKVSTQRKLAPL